MVLLVGAYGAVPVGKRLCGHAGRRAAGLADAWQPRERSDRAHLVQVCLWPAVDCRGLYADGAKCALGRTAWSGLDGDDGSRTGGDGICRTVYRSCGDGPNHPVGYSWRHRRVDRYLYAGDRLGG
ncbi:hypothetical protein D3C78_1392560 [compost metagenome]